MRAEEGGRPSHVLQPTDLRQDHGEPLRLLGIRSEERAAGHDTSEAERRGKASVTAARAVGIHEPAARSREGDHGVAGTGESLPKGGGPDPEHAARLFTLHLEDLAQDVRQPMRAVQALKHAQRAADLHFLEEQCRVRAATWRSLVGQPLLELGAKAREGVPLLFEPALAGREQVVGGDTIRPGRERAGPPKGAQAGHYPDQDLLGGVAGILRVPQHADGQAVDPILDRENQTFQGLAVAFARRACEILEGLRGHESLPCRAPIRPPPASAATS